MRIVVVGQGGREHALAWRLSRDGHNVTGVPGNPGVATVGRCLPMPPGKLTGIVAGERPDLVVIGPEAPLAEGLADQLRAAGLTVFGPSQQAARIETSKAFAKGLMTRAGVPTARSHTAHDASEVEAALAELGGAVAVKADGLAAGKGVVVCSTIEEARAAAQRLLAGGPVVIEERLDGPEVSLIGITDGKNVALLPPARDHKRLLDGDQGPNTGGMGAVTPVALPSGMLGQIRETIFRPTLAALDEVKTPFTGALFAGLMLTRQGPKVLEFNARFGDPETQALMVALPATVDVGTLLLGAATGHVEDTDLQADGAVCGVVLAAPGYPDAPRTGDAIEGVRAAQESGAEVFHAGTRLEGDRLVTSGGRVVCVTAKRARLAGARAAALSAAALVRFPGVQYRRDIGASSEG